MTRLGLDDLLAAVRATNDVIRDPAATQKDLEAAAARENEVVSGYLQAEHTAAQAEAQAEAG